MTRTVISAINRRRCNDGFTSKLVWKAWDFSFSLRSNLGNYVYNNVASSNAALSEGSINNKGYLSNRPLSAFDTNFQNMNVLSDYYVQNASFLRCDNITLGYSFNKLFGVLGGRDLSERTRTFLCITENIKGIGSGGSERS